MPQITTSCRTDRPLLSLTMISHGTLTSLDLQASRRFYEEVFGFEVIQVSPVSLVMRHGSAHTYVVVETGEPSTMSMFDHNGIDVATRAEVEQAHAILRENKERYGIRRINKLMEQHGVYSFYFEDLDGNWWEVLQAPEGGYSYLLDQGRDITGLTHLDPDDVIHTADEAFAAKLRSMTADSGEAASSL
jgi:catechol 2,3-dioxygenase-like lactoylglutathione lyase family enzyme